MPDPAAAAIAIAALAWALNILTHAHARHVNTRRHAGRQRRDRSVRELKHRARRWYRWEGRAQLIGAHTASLYIHQRASRLWRDAKDLEAEPDTAYALRALPFTTRR